MNLGGQAVVEGVMMRNKEKAAVAVRKPNNKIKVISLKPTKISKVKIPFVRGICVLIDTLYLGMKALLISADEQETKKTKISNWGIYGSIIFSVLVSILVFIFLPLFLSRLLATNPDIINILDGIFRIIIFTSYLLVISMSKDIRQVFQYHGAEHKVVHCYEDKKKLTVKNCKPYSTLHPRCGTAFIFIVLIISILVFTLIRFPNFWYKFLGRLILLPVVAGISYEILRLGGKYKKSKIMKIIISPGLLLQKITTKKPTDKQIEVAIAAAKKVI